MELPHVGMPNAGEEADNDVSGKQAIGGIVVLIIFLALVIGIAGTLLSYWVHGAGFAALLPGIVDHHPRERRLFKPRNRTMWEWFDDNKGAIAGYAILGFVVLWAAGVVR